MAGHREGRAAALALLAAAGAVGRRGGGRRCRILDRQKNRYTAIGGASFKRAKHWLVTRIFIGLGGTLAVAADEI
jgi:hypothetical protein